MKGNVNLLCFLVLASVFVFIKVEAFSIAAERNVHQQNRRVKKQLDDAEFLKEQRDFDHLQFLGSDEEVDEFDHMTPEESRRRLTLLVERNIDLDHDGNITETELKQWIYKSQRKHLTEDVDRQWSMHTDGDSSVTKLSWQRYKNKTYGFLESFEARNSEADMTTYKEMLKRDERRWKAADLNGDGSLDRDEFPLFLHPEEDPRMHSVVVDETLEDIDRDGDGRLSEAEYIADLYAPDANSAPHSVPEWVSKEREQFHTYRDTNKDGFLDRDEIRDWIVPANYDHAEAEAKHLIAEADVNHDGVLSMSEILDNYDVFVGSQATDFGDALTRHDEF